MCISDSYTLAITGSTDIGLNCEGRVADGDFGIGVSLLPLIRGFTSCNALVEQLSNAHGNDRCSAFEETG